MEVGEREAYAFDDPQLEADVEARIAAADEALAARKAKVNFSGESPSP